MKAAQIKMNDLLYPQIQSDGVNAGLSGHELDEFVSDGFRRFYASGFKADDQWFISSEDLGAQKKCKYKVRFDGCHFLGTIYKTPVKGGERKLAPRTLNDDMFDEFYVAGVKMRYSGRGLKRFLKFSFADFYSYDDAVSDDFLNVKIESKERNLYGRKRRFLRKALLNIKKWNRFVTITNDGTRTEEEFRNDLKKNLSNHHTRNGWNYMGTFEHAPETGRLHFHALMYIPDLDKTSKEITKVEEYNPLKNKMEFRWKSPFYDEKFGRSDFKPVDDVALKYGRQINYIVKYIGKDNEKIFYSRGVPDFLLREFENDEILGFVTNFITIYLFNDIVLDSDSEINIREREDERYYSLE